MKMGGKVLCLTVSLHLTKAIIQMKSLLLHNYSGNYAYYIKGYSVADSLEASNQEP